MSPGIFIFSTIALYVTFSYSLQRLCKKLDVKPAWLAWTPFHPFLIYKAGGQPGWWFVILFIPFIQIIALVVLLISWVKIFRKLGWKAAIVPLASFSLLLISTFFQVISFLTSSEPYKLALAEIQRDPDVIRALGQPINATGVQGNITTTDDGGTACLFIPVSGSQETGLVGVEAVRLNEVWKLHRLVVKAEKTQTLWIVKAPSENTEQEPCPDNGIPKVSSWEIFQEALELEKQQDYKKAYEYYTLGIKLDPNNARFYTNRGGLLTDFQKYKDALMDLNRAIEIDPKNFIAYNNRGNVHSALGDKKAAIRDLSKAIQINPSYARAYYNRGIYFADMGNSQQAFSDFNQAIKLNKNYLEAYMERGKLYRKLGKKTMAVQDFQQSIKLATASKDEQLEKIAKNELSKTK